MSEAIKQLTALGQSLWYDNIERRLLNNGELERMVVEGDIRGLTSNPTIFQKAIVNSNDYDAALKTLAWSGHTATQIFEQLSIEDIRRAADLLLPLYRETNGGDGFVSLEVNPLLANDTESTFHEAVRLWNTVTRPNLMVKIPATAEGVPAIQRAIAAGVNINITLIFSIARYLDVMNAYLTGLEERVSRGEPVNNIASVASFFVSRMDSKVDKALEEIIREEDERAESAKDLLSQSAIANARLAYREFKRVFGDERFARLKEHGAQLQRPLWASTSTKNPALPDTLYVDTLIGPHTVNTVPTQTLAAFKDHGSPRISVEDDLAAAEAILQSLEKLGISVERVTQELEEEAVVLFSKSFEDVTNTIETRRQEAVRMLGPLEDLVPAVVRKLESERVVERMHSFDPTVWTNDTAGMAEARNRLGWLDLPQSSRAALPEMEKFASEVRSAGFTHALLLGMGGSSLAPEVMRLVYGSADPQGAVPGLDLAILDSTEPAQVLAAAERAPLDKTLFIVASKSGGTAEVTAFFDYFWAQAEKARPGNAGDFFVAVTDPGTSLEKLAQERGFRGLFHADPTVGGRYSALAAFGLLPAVLMGLNPRAMLDKALLLEKLGQPSVPAGRNPGLVLGAVIGEAAKMGRDKLTLIADPALAAIGSWMEQLVAESSGKEGKGIVPVDGEKPAAPESYAGDRLFVYLRRSGDFKETVKALLEAGQPVLTFYMDENADLGLEFYRWEYATAVACALLGVNAFDQPNVQDAKTRTKAKIAEYQSAGRFNEGEPAWTGGGMKAYVSPALAAELNTAKNSLPGLLDGFCRAAHPDDYFAVLAYLPRNLETSAKLAGLQNKLRARTNNAATAGFGPRYLHSTGQLHKGGPNRGVFLLLSVEPERDIEIPTEGLTFGALVRGQTLGDLEALLAQNRRVLRLHLNSLADLERVIAAI